MKFCANDFFHKARANPVVTIGVFGFASVKDLHSSGSSVEQYTQLFAKFIEIVRSLCIVAVWLPFLSNFPLIMFSTAAFVTVHPPKLLATETCIKLIN